jgi:hypothetical protein
MSNRHAITQRRKQLRAENKKYSDQLVEISKDRWPDAPASLLRAYRSKNFLVQVYGEASGERVSVCRAALDHKGEWRQDITWDELWTIKNQLGYGDAYAIEIYPQRIDFVNVANMRHLWILHEPLDVGWFAYGAGE